MADYKKHYKALVGRAASRIKQGYTERHHITPKCLGGDECPDNLVELTAREHYIAHLMLVKIHTGNSKLVFAAHMMTIDRYGRRIGNRKYEWLRRLHSESTRRLKMGNTHTLGCKWTRGTKLKMSASAMGNKRNLGNRCPDEVRSKISNAHMGKIKSKDHCANISIGQRERVAKLKDYKCGTPRYPGVTERFDGTYIARVREDGKRKHIGYFRNATDAIAAMVAYG